MPVLKLLIIVLLLTGFYLPVSAGNAKFDYRVLIDESQSMGDSDPENLRHSAINLLTALIPQGASAGVWAYGRYSDMIVRWGKVDHEWRLVAANSSEQTQANGSYSNIESALSRSSRSWVGSPASEQRVVILLTDGGINISKHAAKNKKSRDRVMGPLLETLKAKGVAIHSIALASGSDEELLRRLASETGGSFNHAQTASELPALLLALFERINDSDGVPFEGQSLPVDETIDEMTLVLFRKPGDPAVELTSADGSVIKPDGQSPGQWFSNDEFHLFRLDKPTPGLWQLNAQLNSPSRLMVVSELNLKVSGIPSEISTDSGITVNVDLFRWGERVRKNSFLRFVTFTLRHIKPDGSIETLPLSPAQDRQLKGRYQLQLKAGLEPGTHRLEVRADGHSFNRSREFNLSVVKP